MVDEFYWDDQQFCCELSVVALGFDTAANGQSKVHGREQVSRLPIKARQVH